MYEIEKRFCKDEKLPIKLFEEPYFSERLALFGKYDEYQAYREMIEERFHGNGEEYLAYYNDVKDRAIDYIKGSEAFLALNADDMNKYGRSTQYPKKDAFKDHCIGHRFISIDMQKANFTALVHYANANGLAFADGYDYDTFIGQFTDIDHIIRSKYIRQVVFGNCNPKRQVTYESYLMSKMLEEMIGAGIVSEDGVHSLMSDEILLRGENIRDETALRDFVAEYAGKHFPLHYEAYTVGKIEGSGAYVKRFEDGTYETKCVGIDEAVFIRRFMDGDTPTENDHVFVYEGKKARFLETPVYSIIL